MSAPDTNTEKQEKAHRFPLRMGIALPVLFALVLLLVFFVTQFLGGSDPEGADARVDSRTDEVVETEAVTE